MFKVIGLGKSQRKTRKCKKQKKKGKILPVCVQNVDSIQTSEHNILQ